ncbi:uncharacterized protein Dvir_GJ16413 [Drosophila virilis]|uniref:DUF4777 domain-containing protein n=2 Tax=Drosophila virilis TaxID=7244 RepID=A0A0Q9WII5_DROVI|nr:uncharacterized protein Dvir_GJ16413 [Drosophila virilis]
MQPLQTSRSHQLNVSAPSFTPASARAVGGGLTPATGIARRPPIPLIPSQSQPQLQSQSQSHSRSQSERSNGRRQQLPDLFQTVLKLMRELNRSVSYPEMIGMLSMRLQRLPVELKRHIPHTLHGAVANGYLRKDGNYYTLLSEQEQKEIMKRNQEAAKRAKELEKEPLSWRIR